MKTNTTKFDVCDFGRGRESGMGITHDDSGELRTAVVAQGPWGGTHSAPHIITHSAIHKLGLPPSETVSQGQARKSVSLNIIGTYPSRGAGWVREARRGRHRS
jgi:hypothetical protein